MRIKHKDSEKHSSDPSVALEHWHNIYSENNKYLNYEFYDVPNIVDIYEIDKETGNTVFLKSSFEWFAKRMVEDNPQKIIYKPLAENRLDEYLMPKKTDYLGISFFKRILTRIKQIIKPKKNPTKIPFSRSELIQMKIGISAIAIAIMIPIALFIIEKMYF